MRLSAIPKLNLAFWTLAAIDAFAVLVMAGLFFADNNQGQHDGSRSMGLTLFLALPTLALGAAILLFVFGRFFVLRVLALLIAAGPALILGGIQASNYFEAHEAEQRALGRGYFADRTMDALAEAVTRADVPTLEKLSRGIDLNTSGEKGVTLLWLAVTLESDEARLRIVTALLQLGAKPKRAHNSSAISEVSPALLGALMKKDDAVVKALLDAGADPNALDNSGAPLIFGASSAMTPTSMQLLAARNVNFDALWGSTPLSVWLAMDKRWDLLSLLIERGVDVSKTYSELDKRTAASFVDAEINARAATSAPDAALLSLRSQLSAKPAAR